MIKLFCLLVLALLSGCASYSYPVQDAGDGVYYAAAPPDYTYVYVPYSPAYFYAMPYSMYYSPYFYPHYFAVWSSPLIEQHFTSPDYWVRNRPYTLPPSGQPYRNLGQGPTGLGAIYGAGDLGERRSLPVDLRNGTVTPLAIQPMYLTSPGSRAVTMPTTSTRRARSFPVNLAPSRPSTRAFPSSSAQSARPAMPSRSIPRGQANSRSIRRD